MSHLQLIWLSSAIALLGTGMLTLTAVLGNLLTSHKNQNFTSAYGVARYAVSKSAKVNVVDKIANRTKL